MKNIEPGAAAFLFYLAHQKEKLLFLQLFLMVLMVLMVLEPFGTIKPYQKRQRENFILSALVGFLFLLYFSNGSEIRYIGVEPLEPLEPLENLRVKPGTINPKTTLKTRKKRVPLKKGIYVD